MKARYEPNRTFCRLKSFDMNIWRGNKSVYKSQDNLQTVQGQFDSVNAFISTMRLIFLADFNYTVVQIKVIVLQELVILVY